MMKYRILACFCCSSPNNSPRAADTGHKDTTAVSEPTAKAVDEAAHLDKLRSEVKTMIVNQQQANPPIRDIEDIVVGVDYLPVYCEESGKLTFNGAKLKITFTEPRLKAQQPLA